MHYRCERLKYEVEVGSGCQGHQLTLLTIWVSRFLSAVLGSILRQFRNVEVFSP